MSAGRVLIAFDDGPLVASPTYTAIDQGGSFPQNFVSGYDLNVGRQSLLAQTDTGEGAVYINDFKYGLFDPRNSSSTYYGKLDGKQIVFQLYDPTRAVWEPQFGGTIGNASYDIDGSAIDANGDPINASIQLNCVDMFDYLAGYGLTPGLDGVNPIHLPAGSKDGIWYAETTGTVDDRIIEILTDAGIDPVRYVVASGNVQVQAIRYDPDEKALVALRDACDAELPFIANMLCNRHGQFQFHGRYARFDPDGVSAEPGSQWDFHRWYVGDEKAIKADSSRAQMRVLGFSRGRDNVINVATSYPKNMKPDQMPSQVYADTTSVTDFGEHPAPPMSDLLTKHGAVTGNDRYQETLLYAKLLVENQKDPREAITALQIKSLHPDDYRATETWPLLTQADISDIVNVRVGYPGGTGFTGTSPADDYYVEGRQMRVRPLEPSFDYVELDLNVTPAVWSMDTHGVFPAFS